MSSKTRGSKTRRRSNRSVHVLVDERLFDVEEISAALHAAVLSFAHILGRVADAAVQVVPVDNMGLGLMECLVLNGKIMLNLKR